MNVFFVWVWHLGWILSKSNFDKQNQILTKNRTLTKKKSNLIKKNRIKKKSTFSKKTNQIWQKIQFWEQNLILTKKSTFSKKQIKFDKKIKFWEQNLILTKNQMLTKNLDKNFLSIVLNVHPFPVLDFNKNCYEGFNFDYFCLRQLSEDPWNREVRTLFLQIL